MKQKSEFVMGQHKMLTLYAALMGCSQAIIHSTSKEELFREICRSVVSLGEMSAAWIGMVDVGDEKVWPQAHFGEGMNYLESISMTFDIDDSQGLCPTNTAIREGHPVWCQDLLCNSTMQAWRDRAKLRGWHSSAALPLTIGGKTMGVLGIYASEPHAFDEKSRELLTQMASNLSFALDFFENDDQRRQAEFALMESEVRYSALFANSCMPMLVVDPNNEQIVDANIRAIDFYGWPQTVLISKRIMDINVLSSEEIRHEMALAINSHKAYFETQHRLANGEIRDVEVFSSPIGFGGQTYLQLAIHDISERRRTQARMLAAQTLTQRFIDQLPGTAYLKDSQLKLLMVNQNLGTLLGVAPETLIGKTAHEFFPADFADTIMALDLQMLERGGSQMVEETFNGRHIETSMFVIDDASGGRLLGGLSLDVTDRYHALERTRALLRINELAGQLPEKALLTEGLELAEQLTHSDIGFLHFVNDDQETVEMVTWTAGALNGCTANYDSHYPISKAGIWADCLRTKQPVYFNDYAGYAAKHGLPEGHTPLRRFISIPIIEGDQVRMLMAVGNKAQDYDQFDVDTLRLIGNDLWRISRRVRVESALKQQVDELVSVNQRLADAQLQLLQAEKMAAIGQLASGVAHEINNPIGFIKSNLGTLSQYVDELMATTAAYAEVERQLGNAHAELFEPIRQRKRQADYDFMVEDLPQLIAESRDGVDRVSKIVMDLKNFSRSGDADWDWADLRVGLESTLNVVWNQLKYKVEVVRELADIPLVYCVASQINQVLMNLLVNAGQAIPVHGRITLRTGCMDGHVWLEVQDTGCGMDDNIQSKIFDPFYTTKPAGQGTGLGLSIANDIMNRHHGALSVNSVVGQGSTFRLSLPIDHRLEAPIGVPP
jgi:PAS domain S-box-containing protein